MSDTSTATEYDYESGHAPEGDPAESGQVGTEGAEPAYFDPSAYQDHLVRIKVDGEEVEVPVAEAINGYMRQADYTRKTQTLAEQRAEIEYARTLQAALETSPAETIGLLSQRYGLNTQPPPTRNEWDDDYGIFDDLDDVAPDPLQGRLAQMEAQFQDVMGYVAQQQLQERLNGLQQTYGDEFNPKEVVTEALRRGTDDLEGVYKAMAFDRFWAQTQAQRADAAQRAAEEQRRTAAKEAAGVIHSGGSSNGASPAPASTPSSIREAFANAKAELGY